MLLGLPPLKPVSNSQCRGVVSFATELRGCCAPHRPLAARLKAQGRKACPLKASAGQSSANPPGPCAARSVDDSDWCEVLSCEFLVIGSGIAGLSYALKVAEHGRVLMVSKETANEGSTAYAQGGISAVFGKDDSVESHILDTMRAGGYLNTYEAVEAVCREGPQLVLDLVEMGAVFTQGLDGKLDLTREGGHSHRRVVHAADVTGREVERALLDKARKHPNISIMECHAAVDLVIGEVEGQRHCLGLDVLDIKATGMQRIVAPVTLLASGGAGHVYPNTTNPHVTTGDGMAMSFRAKAQLSGLEFVQGPAYRAWVVLRQFHPTGFYTGELGQTFLISEAVRGEGGHLLNLAKERFMDRYDDRLELAPRDVVARSIHDQMMAREESHVLLDVSHEPAEAIRHHFPNIAARCKEYGIDITQQPIPVVPTQHYCCGGVQTNMSGETVIPGLYACGEVAHTGLHGANRLASNSLLEGLVLAARAVVPTIEFKEATVQKGGAALQHAISSVDFTGTAGAVRLPDEVRESIAAKRTELTHLMWSAAGIVRHTKDMEACLPRLTQLYAEAWDLRQQHGIAPDLQELLNLVTVGSLIMVSALERKESRGLHFTPDYPHVSKELACTVIHAAGAGDAPHAAMFSPDSLRNICKTVPAPAATMPLPPGCAPPPTSDAEAAEK